MRLLHLLTENYSTNWSQSDYSIMENVLFLTPL